VDATNEPKVKKDIEYFRQLAHEYMREHGCRWSVACLAIKRRHPEACEVWKAPRTGETGR
jgi:hypothetical protein